MICVKVGNSKFRKENFRMTDMNPADFLFDRYRELLKFAVERFNPASYHTVNGPADIFWRHDCDFTLSQAEVVGRIDQEEGMKSTFFVNIHADSYNALSQFGQRIIQTIKSQGHEIGIHLDTQFYGGASSSQHLVELLESEKATYFKYFGETPKVFSFHNPTVTELLFDDLEYAGLINCYSRNFRDNWRYVSDSNGYWRYDSLKKVLETESELPLQVLTHPEWWSTTGMEPRERLVSSLLLSTFVQIIDYDKNIAEFGRLNLSECEEMIRKFAGNDIGLQIILTAICSLELQDGESVNHLYPSAIHGKIDKFLQHLLAFKEIIP